MSNLNIENNSLFIVFDNSIVWIILILGLACYSLLIEYSLLSKKNTHWYHRARQWSQNLPAMLNALPLLGLLGTISGLLQTFRSMAANSSSNLQELITSGIADAMFTTQLGLLLVVPGWLLLSRLNAQLKRWEVLQPTEVTCDLA